MVGTLIEKEKINEHKLIPAEKNNVEELFTKLNDALRLGNEFKSKVSIAFNASSL